MFSTYNYTLSLQNQVPADNSATDRLETDGNGTPPLM